MIERRYLASEFELRGTAGVGATLAGYAAVFNSPAVIAGMFREQIAPRAFRKTIKEGDVRALFNHDVNIVLGRNKSGTLRLAEDDHGLGYEIDLPNTQIARDLWTSIERGDISQSSFAFEVVNGKERVEYPDDDEAGLPLRTIREVRLYDVSPVTYPAYEDTEVQARAADLMATWSIPNLADIGGPGIPAAVADRAEATTDEPEPEPQEHSDTTHQPEPAIDRTRLALDELDLLAVEWGIY